MQILLSYEGYDHGKFKKKVKNLDVEYDNMKEKYQH